MLAAGGALGPATGSGSADAQAIAPMVANPETAVTVTELRYGAH